MELKKIGDKRQEVYEWIDLDSTVRDDYRIKGFLVAEEETENYCMRIYKTESGKYPIWKKIKNERGEENQHVKICQTEEELRAFLGFIPVAKKLLKQVGKERIIVE